MFFLSCSQDLDLKELEGYTATPLIKVSFLSFNQKIADIAPTEFIDGYPFATAFPLIDSLPDFSKKSEFIILKSSFIQENLKELEFDFRIKNEFNAEYTIEVLFLCNNNNPPIISFIFQISANNEDYRYNKIVDITRIKNLRKCTQIEFKLKVKDLDLNTADLETEFDFKSSATLKFESSL